MLARFSRCRRGGEKRGTGGRKEKNQTTVSAFRRQDNIRLEEGTAVGIQYRLGREGSTCQRGGKMVAHRMRSRKAKPCFSWRRKYEYVRSCFSDLSMRRRKKGGGVFEEKSVTARRVSHYFKWKRSHDEDAESRWKEVRLGFQRRVIKRASKVRKKGKAIRRSKCLWKKLKTAASLIKH